MKKGRKFDFHKDVLSNAGPKVAFRCNYPQSRTVAGFLWGRDGQDVSAALEQLAVGQAYVSTPAQTAARKVFMLPDDHNEEDLKLDWPDLNDCQSSDSDDGANGMTPSIRADGSILYGDGRIGVPNPSPGHVIVTRYGRTAHYSTECQDLKNKNSIDWLTYPDPDRDLWRDILVVAPIADKVKRAQFARSIGLVNREGGPILWMCERCVLCVPPRRI